MFAGIMGGANSYSPYGNDDNYEKFGQIDSGNFIYENLGVKWIVDLGSDNFSVNEYFGKYRYQYYRNSAEGHNMIILPDLMYGQNEVGDGRLYDKYIDPDGKGSYAKIDNSNAYGSYISSANRGMLVTNDRKTVVIQDEFKLNDAGRVVWTVQTCEEILIDETGLVAYLIHKEGDETIILRATIVTTLESIGFSALECEETILSGAKGYDNTQIERPEGLKRLVIDANVVSLDIAVVFEIVESTQSELAVGYEWKNLVEWDSYFTEEEESSSVPTYDPSTNRYKDIVNYAAVICEDYLQFTTGLADFYEALCNISYMCKRYEGFDPASLHGTLHEDYEKFVDEYNEYRVIIVRSMTEIVRLTEALSGQ